MFRLKTKHAFIKQLFYFKGDLKKIHKSNQNQSENKDLLETQNLQQETQIEQVIKQNDLMKDNYEFTKIPGLNEKKAVNLSLMQKQIFQNKKFNLMDTAIKPKTASTSLTRGLDLNNEENLLQIDLGNIKIKKQNQIYLSQVDPFNIPQYYDILLKQPKQLSLVGKATTKNSSQTQMKVTEKTFQQISLQEMNLDYFGSKIPNLFKSTNKRANLFLFILGCILFSPFSEACIQYAKCVQSISRIQNDRLLQLNKIKTKIYGQTIINNQDFNIRF